MIENSQTASDCIKYQIKFLKITGLWYPSPIEDADISTVMKSKLNNPRIYSYYSITLRAIFLYLYILPGFLYIRGANDVEEITKGLFVLMQITATVFKTYYFLKNGKQLKMIVKEIQSSSYFVPQSNIEEKYLKTAFFKSRLLTIAYFGNLIITMILWMIQFIITNRLPFPAKYPYLDNENPKHFYAIASLEWCSSILPTIWASLIDSLSWGCFAMITYCIKILGERLSNIGHHHNKINNKKLNLIKQKDANQYYYKELIKNIEFHNYILNFTKHCEKAFARTIFMQMTVSTIVLCTSTYQLLLMPFGSIEFYSTVSYVTTVFLQMFSYTYLGNEIIYWSRRLSTNAYFSNFVEFNKKTSVALIIFLIRTTLLDISVTAGEILRFSVSLETFVTIIKSSYSYLAVLRELD